MSDPHNPERYGEKWPQPRIDAYLTDLEVLKPFVVISGGWAWHFLSPEGHDEYKHAHDHKDVDLFVPKNMVGTVMGLLQGLGYQKVSTKYDRLPSSEDFRRYERTVEIEGQSFRLTIDFFVGDQPTLEMPGGWKIVRPDVLLSFYGKVHSSDKCWAVEAATRLLANGDKPEDLIGRGDLLACPELPVFICTHCGWAGQFPKREWHQIGGESWNGTEHAQFPECPRCDYRVSSVGLPTYRPKAEVIALAQSLISPDPLMESRKEGMMKNFREVYGGKKP